MLENLTNSDVLVLAGLIGVIIVIGVICIILTIKGGKNTSSSKKVDSKEVPPSSPDIHIALATENIPNIDKEKSSEEELIDEPLENEIIDIDEEESKEDSLFPSYSAPVQENIETISDDDFVIPVETASVEHEQDNKTNAKIEEVLKAMQNDLEKQKYEKIDRYEEEQEENAVISYQELMQRKMAIGANDTSSVVNEQPDELASPDYLDDIPDFKDVVLEPIADRNEDRPFVNSEFVSPIFGRLSSNAEYPTVKKTVQTTESLETEVISPETIDLENENDEFLNTLKEFRKNL